MEFQHVQLKSSIWIFWYVTGLRRTGRPVKRTLIFKKIETPWLIGKVKAELLFWSTWIAQYARKPLLKICENRWNYQIIKSSTVLMSDNRIKSNKIGPKLDLNLVKLQGGPKWMTLSLLISSLSNYQKNHTTKFHHGSITWQNGILFGVLYEVIMAFISDDLNVRVIIQSTWMVKNYSFKLIEGRLG